MGRQRTWIIILLTLSVVIIVITIISLMPNKISKEQQEKQKINKELSLYEITALLKSSMAHLTINSELQSYSFTDDSMILFALDYLQITGKIGTEQVGDYTTVNRNLIEETIKEIFDKTIDYDNVTFEYDYINIDVPYYPTSTDLQTFKLKQKEYNNLEGTYTVYIDCLDTSPSEFESIFEDKVTEYDERYVSSTLIFKYREIEDRRILLSFNFIYK